MSEITDELFTAAVTAYYSRRFGFRADDKEFLLLMLDNDMHDDDLRAALAVAFAAGRESAYEGGGIDYEVRTKAVSWPTFSEAVARNEVRQQPDRRSAWFRRRGPWLPVDGEATR